MRFRELQSLHLSNNNLSGLFPISFQNLSSLETLDLGNNKFSGRIPSWVGYNFPKLRIISLRSNDFYGEIPIGISNLSSLQILDLAKNSLSGPIPTSLGELKSIQEEQKVNKYLFFGNYNRRYFEESLVVNLKGTFKKFTKNLALVTSIDLSSNNLSGVFPQEITKLTGLVILDFSKNHIVGEIPENISKMRELGSLDLSNNNISGTIPPNMLLLSSLGYLNISNNNLSGPIPNGGQMSTFDDSSFIGNFGLCGYPPSVKCNGDDSKGEDNDENESNDHFVDEWFYLSVVLGFVAGIVVPFVAITIRKPWGEVYYGFVDKIVCMFLSMRYRG